MRRIKNPPPEIPTIADYSHYNEDAALVWYQENRYDMEHHQEMLDEWENDPDNFDWEEDE